MVHVSMDLDEEDELDELESDIEEIGNAEMLDALEASVLAEEFRIINQL